jgi:hypothetical protein
LKAVHLVSHVFQESGGGLSLFTRQPQFNREKPVEAGILDGGDAMSFLSLCPTEVGTCGVKDGHEQRRHAENNWGETPSLKYLLTADRQESCDGGEDDDG